MGHKHSTLHRQLKQQDVPNLDLVTATDSGGGGSGGTPSANSSYVEVKQGPFRRKLSMRNISIRRSFHISKKSHTRLNNKVAAATTDDIRVGTSSNSAAAQSSSSTTVPNGGGSTDLTLSTPLPSTSTPTPVSLPRAANSNRNGDKYVMDRLRRSFRNSFRRKKDHVPESIKPHQWQSDEQAVKAGTCQFPVKYLGCAEVFESRGMQVCEDALRRLRNNRRRATKGTLYVTGDGLRVVDDETKGLIVDQTIEKVSFCAPDRSHERGFSYICRDGTTRRWMCHGFHAAKDSGERLSHAVGCAFAVCLERKQRRDKEAVSSVFDPKTATFTRTGSFRASSITERMQDPQVAKPADPPPLKPVHNPYAVERPHAAANLLQRQGSLRGGPLNHVSPFKRQLSLRVGVDSLPSLLTNSSSGTSSAATPTSPTTTVSTTAATNSTQRERAHSLDLTATLEGLAPSKRPGPGSLFMSGNPKVTLVPSVAPIEEVSPSCDKPSNPLLAASTSVATADSLQTQQTDGSTSPAIQPAESSIITAMCQELTQGLSMLAAKTADEDLRDASFSSWSPGHFSPPAALCGTTTTSAAPSFTAFDKWISTNNTGSNNSSSNSTSKKFFDSLPKQPLVPPPVVDQMPQVTAPPPPSSPSYSTTVFSGASQFSKGASRPTDYHSALFSDLTNSLKDNLIGSKTGNTTATIAESQSLPISVASLSSSIPVTASTTIMNGDATARTLTTNGSSPFPSATVTDACETIDPFDAGWAELTNRHLTKSVSPTGTAAAATNVNITTARTNPSSSPVFGVSSTTPAMTAATAAAPFSYSSVPLRSTNPFLDLSQYETESTASTTGSVNSMNSVPATTTTTTQSQSISPQPQQQQQQIFTKAFEVHM